VGVFPETLEAVHLAISTANHALQNIIHPWSELEIAHYRNNVEQSQPQRVELYFYPERSSERSKSLLSNNTLRYNSRGPAIFWNPIAADPLNKKMKGQIMGWPSDGSV
jgi:hypothetical protein